MFYLAEQEDLPQIVSIYNQTIAARNITADLEELSVQDRQEWFDFHQAKQDKYPLWVYKKEGQVLGWCSYSPFYDRKAYDGAVEISLYLDRQVHGQGLGKELIRFLKAQMQAYDKKTLLAFVFGDNKPSLAALKKEGFREFGFLPQVADMQDHEEDLVILGYQTHL